MCSECTGSNEASISKVGFELVNHSAFPPDQAPTEYWLKERLHEK